jgi:hypothetical protein
MASDNVTRIGPHATPPEPEGIRAPYTDSERDYRDCLILNAIKAAISLIEGEERDLASDVLRLARDRLEASWPHGEHAKFTADEVAHG